MSDIWTGCTNAIEVLRRMLTLDEDADLTDAPVWGEIPADIRPALVGATVWSWDADGVVIGLDGSFPDDEPAVYLWYDDIRQHVASGCRYSLHTGVCEAD